MEEKDPAFWNRKAKEALDVAKKLQPIQTSAKNLIIFLGDGECVRPGHSEALVFQALKVSWWAEEGLWFSSDQILFLQGWGCPQ